MFIPGMLIPGLLAFRLFLAVRLLFTVFVFFFFADAGLRLLIPGMFCMS